MEWNKIDVNIRSLASCNFFKKVKLKFIRHEPVQVFNVNNSEGLAWFTIN